MRWAAICLSIVLWFHPLVPRVRTLACLSGVSLERDVPEEQIRECIHTADNVTWVDVEDPGEREIAMLLEEFGFHPLALEEAQKGHQRPKIAEYKGYILVVTYGVGSVDGTSELQASEVDIFIGRNYAVTIHRNPSPALDEAYRRWTRGGAMLREGVGFLVFTIVDSVIDTYFPVLGTLEEDLDETELSIFNQPHKDSVQELLATKRQLATIRRVLSPLRETFSILLRRDHPILTQNTTIYFQHVYDNILRILDVVDVQRDLVSSSLDAHMTVVSNRLNHTMKTLTLMTVGVAIGGLVFGAWGMNFSRIPFAEEPWGFPAVFGGTIALIGIVLVLSRKRRWL
jgi:magnesium transporter